MPESLFCLSSQKENYFQLPLFFGIKIKSISNIQIVFTRNYGTLFQIDKYLVNFVLNKLYTFVCQNMRKLSRFVKVIVTDRIIVSIKLKRIVYI